MQLYRILPICLALALSGYSLANETPQEPAQKTAQSQGQVPAQTPVPAPVPTKPAATALQQLPVWEALDFEEKAFWTTAKARITLPTPVSKTDRWKLSAVGSIENTYELVGMEFDATTGQLITRERLSKGRREQRHKAWEYRDGFIIRKRRNPPITVGGDPGDWPVNHARRVYYPDSHKALPVTSEYLLLLLASRVASAGPGTSQDVLVHTDLNFFRARLTAIPGKRIKCDYAVTGGKRVRGTCSSNAVRIRMRPEGRQEEKPDYNLLGLHGDITLYFDQSNGLPLLLHGDAPRLGTTDIHLRGMTPRRALQ